MLSNDAGSAQDRASRPDAWLYLEEITHRTLNDYTAMLAMVRRAAQSVSDEASEHALGEVALRLRAGATSFLALRPPVDGRLRDLSKELESLCASLSNSILSERRVTLVLTSEPVAISAYRCWQISLIISELVTNSARHAFRLRDDGCINIVTSVVANNIECGVIDDGTCGVSIAPGRGTAIVDALVNDLGGSISRNHTMTGSTIIVSVPLAEAFFVPTMRKTIRPLSQSPKFRHLDLGDTD